MSRPKIVARSNWRPKNSTEWSAIFVAPVMLAVVGYGSVMALGWGPGLTVCAACIILAVMIWGACKLFSLLLARLGLQGRIGTPAQWESRMIGAIAQRQARAMVDATLKRHLASLEAQNSEANHEEIERLRRQLGL